MYMHTCISSEKNPRYIRVHVLDFLVLVLVLTTLLGLIAPKGLDTNGTPVSRNLVITCGTAWGYMSIDCIAKQQNNVISIEGHSSS